MIIIVATATAMLMLLPATAVSAGGRDHSPERTVVDVDYLGEDTFDTGTIFGDTEVGGLSSITYDRWRRIYYVLSDDQGTINPVRYYSAKIDLRDGSLDDGDVTFVGVTTLYERHKTPYAPGSLDPEGLALGPAGQLYVSSEGLVLNDPIIDPFIKRYNRQGRVTGHLPIPDKYIPNGVDKGVRHNLAFESLNLTPNRRYLVTAGEGALFQDGPASTFTNGSLARVLTYDLRRKQPVSEYVYEVDPWAEPSVVFGVNGIVEVLPIDNVGTMLVMERSFSVGGTQGGGTGNVVSIYEVSTKGATDVLNVDALYEGGSPISFTPVSKRLLFEFNDLGIPIDNIEGMTFGPRLPDGRHSLVIVSDNNFSAGQFTQFVVLALDIDPVG
jgi:hypothetical protein